MKTSRRSFAKILGAVALVPTAELVFPPPGGSKEQGESVEKLRAVKLKNGDEPDFTFQALAKR